MQLHPSTPSESLSNAAFTPAPVYVTTDYEMFALASWNRSVGHAPQIQKSIQTIGNFLPYYPIKVVPEGGKLVVFDGQGRFTAAKRLGLPVHYIICHGMEKRHVPSLNGAVAKWKSEDYLDHFVHEGFEDYAAAKATSEKYPHLTLSFIVMTGQGGDSTQSGKDWKEGAWCFENEGLVTQIAEAASDFQPHFAGWSDSLFHKALRHAILNPGYEHDWFLSRFEAGAKMDRQRTIPDYLTAMTDVYRWRARGERALFRFEEVYANPKLAAMMEGKRRRLAEQND